MGEPASEDRPSVDWADFADEDVKGYFCRQGDGQFVAYLNWAAAADLQLSLYSLATEYDYYEDIPVPYEGFPDNPTGAAASGEERIGHNEIMVIKDEDALKRAETGLFRYASAPVWILTEDDTVESSEYRLDVYVTRAEARAAFLAVRQLPQPRFSI